MKTSHKNDVQSVADGDSRRIEIGLPTIITHGTALYNRPTCTSFRAHYANLKKETHTINDKNV